MKKFLAGLLTAVFAFSTAAGIAGCSFGSDNENPDDTDITQPDDNNKYSKILNDVLNSDYYNGIIDDAEKYNLRNILIAQDIPFKTLEAQGFPFETITNGNYIVDSNSYFKEGNHNEFYIRTAVSKKGENEHSTIFNLKYNITDKEYSDLIMLTGGGYVQSTFFIQELDKQKTPTVVNSFKIDTESYKDMLYALNHKKSLQGFFGENDFETFTPTKIAPIKDEKDAYMLTMDVISSSKNDNSITSRQISTFDASLYWNAGVSYTNNILRIADCSFVVESSSEPITIKYLNADYLLLRYNFLVNIQ